MKYETVEEWFLCALKKSGLGLSSIGQKTLPGQTMHFTANFLSQKLLGVPNKGVCGLNNFFDQATPWLSKIFFNITASAEQTMYFRINVIKQNL